MERSKISAILCAMGVLVLILDTKTAIMGAWEGIYLCLETVVPSLFLFLFLTSMITPNSLTRTTALLRPLWHLMGIPEKAGPLWLVGTVSGYPIGAKNVADACRRGFLSPAHCRRMLAFCSNAGPGFLFGIGSRLFTASWMCWAVWGIQIITAVIVAMLTPKCEGNAEFVPAGEVTSVQEAMISAIRTMAMICGWVILFRVILTFFDRWFLWRFPAWASCLFRGALELTNGCCSLKLVQEESVRFILFSLLLGFGGMCVTMQTFGVCQGVNPSFYLPGKLTQSILSALLSAIVVSREIRDCFLYSLLLILVCAVYYLRGRRRKNRIDFLGQMLYTKRNLHMR